MKCNHHIEQDMQLPFGILMQMNGKWRYRSTKVKKKRKKIKHQKHAERNIKIIVIKYRGLRFSQTEFM